MSGAVIAFNKISPAIALTPEACARMDQLIGPRGTICGTEGTLSELDEFLSAPDAWAQLFLYTRKGIRHETNVAHFLCDALKNNQLPLSQLLEVVGSFQDDSNKVAVLSMPGFMSGISPQLEITDKALQMQLVDVLIKMTEEGRKALFAANLGDRDRTALKEMHRYVLSYQAGAGSKPGAEHP